MTQNQVVVLIFRGQIASLPKEQQLQVEVYYNKLRKMEAESPLALMAIALRASELAAEGE